MSPGIAGPSRHRDCPAPPDVRLGGLTNNVETRLGTLRFFDGFPDDDTVEKVDDNLDFQRGVQAFLTALPVASLHANARRPSALARRNQTVLMFETLMDPRSRLFGPPFENA